MIKFSSSLVQVQENVKFAFNTRTSYMSNIAHAPSLELDYGLASFLIPCHSHFLPLPLILDLFRIRRLEDRTDTVVTVVNSLDPIYLADSLY